MSLKSTMRPCFSSWPRGGARKDEQHLKLIGCGAARKGKHKARLKAWWQGTVPTHIWKHYKKSHLKELTEALLKGCSYLPKEKTENNHIVAENSVVGENSG